MHFQNRRVDLDIDLLRTLVTGVELGSFGRAAERLGRSQSAVSLQMRRLEEQVGRTLLRKEGRGLVPTEAGELLLSYARRLLALNDEAVGAVAESSVEGVVRVGVPQDLPEGWLAPVLARFSAAHPAVRLEVRIDRSRVLREQAGAGGLDLALLFSRDAPDPGAERIAELEARWIGRPGTMFGAEETVPLVLLDGPCMFREPALAVLDAAGRPWRVALTSPSLAGVWAAASAGLGVTVRTRLGCPRGLVALEARDGWPILPPVGLMLHVSGAGAAVQRLKAELLAELEPLLRGLP